MEIKRPAVRRDVELPTLEPRPVGPPGAGTQDPGTGEQHQLMQRRSEYHRSGQRPL